MADLLFYWFGSNQTRKSVIKYFVSNAADSNPIKYTVLPPLVRIVWAFSAKAWARQGSLIVQDVISISTWIVFGKFISSRDVLCVRTKTSVNCFFRNKWCWRHRINFERPFLSSPFATTKLLRKSKLFKQAEFKVGCRHSSVDSSAPTILPPWVGVPSIYSQICAIFVMWK